MLKILHIDTGSVLRGGQQQLLMLARGLKKRSHEQVIAAGQRSPLHETAQHEGFETLALTLHGAGSLRALLELRRLIRTRGFDIIHAHDGRGQNFSWLSSCGTTTRRVASRRVAFPPRSRRIHRLKYTHTCHGVIAVSASIRDSLLRSGIPPAKIMLIPDGIDFPPNPPTPAEKAEARRQFLLGEDDFVIGHAGAFTREKGQETAIRAFQLITAQLPGARLLLAGDGEYRSRLAESFDLQNPRGAIRLPGRLDSLDSFMDCLDLFIMPSRSEGLGSSALEAMAHGVPVIASRTGGLPEIVSEGENGWLVEPGSAAELAAAMIAAASDRQRLREMGSRARKTASLFTDDIMTSRVESFYHRLLA